MAMKVDVTLLTQLNRVLINFPYARSGYLICRRNEIYVPGNIDLFMHEKEAYDQLVSFGPNKKLMVMSIPLLLKAIRSIRKDPAGFKEFTGRHGGGDVYYRLGEIYDRNKAIRRLDRLASHRAKILSGSPPIVFSSASEKLWMNIINATLDRLSAKVGGMRMAMEWSQRNWPQWAEQRNGHVAKAERSLPRKRGSEKGNHL